MSEWYPDLADTDVKKLHLHYFDGSSWDLKTPNIELDHASSYHYPSISAPPGEDYVYFVTKPTPSSGEPHFQLLKQDRDDLTASAVTTDDFGGTNYRHKRPFLTFDYDQELFGSGATEGLYLCYASSLNGGMDDGVRIKAVELSTDWDSSFADATTKVIADVTDDVEDHCTVAFDEVGTALTPYHFRDGLNENNLDTVHLGIYEWSSGGDTWSTRNSPFALQLPADTEADFPNIAGGFFYDGYETGVSWFILAESMPPGDPGVMLSWHCTGDTIEDCDQAADWLEEDVDVQGTTVGQPMIAWVPLWDHAFAFYELGGLTGDDIGLAKWCHGDTEWTSVGLLARDEANKKNYKFSYRPGSAIRSVAASLMEDDNLHAVFVADNGDPDPDDRDTYVMHWYDDFCNYCDCE